MKMIRLLNDITHQLYGKGLEVDRIVLLNNTIEIDGVILIKYLPKDNNDDYSYKLMTSDFSEEYYDIMTTTDAIVEEVRKIKNFRTGSIVKKYNHKYMLVPHNSLSNSFCLLNMKTHDVGDVFYTQSELYSEFNLVKEDN